MNSAEVEEVCFKCKKKYRILPSGQSELALAVTLSHMKHKPTQCIDCLTGKEVEVCTKAS